MRRIACFVVLATIGCRSETPSEDSPPAKAVVEHEPATPSEPTPTAPKPEKVERQFDWSVPACPLTYHYRADLGAGAATLIIEFDLVMSPHEGGAALHLREIAVSQTLDGKPFGEGMTEPENSLADVHLALGDGVWTEVDGTTKAWSAFDSAPSLMFMWPALPAQRDPGATASWTIAGHHDSPEVARTEAARGSLEIPDGWEPPKWEEPPAANNTVTLESWEANKAILVMDSNNSFEPPGGGEQGSMRQTGRYEVLDSGRLIAAKITIEFDMDGTKATQAAELRLTDGCDEPPKR
jgi:hypothetical protein